MVLFSLRNINTVMIEHNRNETENDNETHGKQTCYPKF